MNQAQHAPLRATPDMDTRDCEYHNAKVADLVAALQRMVDFAIPANCAKGQAVTRGWDTNVVMARAAIKAAKASD